MPPDSFAYWEWSVPPGSDINDIGNVRRANPAFGTRINEEFLAVERAALTEDEYGRERLGIFNEETIEPVIDPVAWARLAAQVVDEGRPAFAVEISPDRSKASIAAAGRWGERIVVSVVDEFAEAIVVQRLVQLKAKWDPCVTMIDPAAPAGSLVPLLEAEGWTKKDDKGNGDYCLVTATTVKQACGGFYDDCFKGLGTESEPAPRLAHNGKQTHLDADILRARKRPLGDAWAWDRSANTPSLIAATLARFGLVEFGQQQEANWDFFTV